MKKLVSIVIPVYNGENYIEEAIESALNQTYKNIEVIVVNDGSTDNTEQIVKKYESKIKYISKENGGVSSALNEGIKAMKGEYFSWLSHDDLYQKTKIETEINEIEKHKKPVIVFSDFLLMFEPSKEMEEVKINSNVKTKYDYLINFSLGGITLLIPKKCFEKVGLFDEKLKYTQDYDLWFKMLKEFDFIHIKKPLAITRIHDRQDTNNKKTIPEGNKFWIKTINELRKMGIYDETYLLAKMSMTLYQPYLEASKYLLDELKNINKKEYKATKNKIKIQKIKNILKNNVIIRSIKYLKTNGIKKTKNKIKTKIKG